MGVFRKLTSVSTLGLVNMHAPRETQAIAAKKNAKASGKEAKAAGVVAAAQARLLDAQRANLPAPDASAAPVLAQPPLDVASQLERLAALREQGILTNEEFDAQKARILA